MVMLSMTLTLNAQYTAAVVTVQFMDRDVGTWVAHAAVRVAGKTFLATYNKQPFQRLNMLKGFLNMYIFVRKEDKIIVGYANRPVNEEDMARQGLDVFQIDSADYSDTMLGQKLESFDQ